jgi:hypothetical protein
MDDSTGAKLMTFSSGFGDGEYSIFGFRNNCGFSRLEVEFIGPKQENI